MTTRLSAWFARQSSTVKLLLAVPLLLLAILWSAWPGNEPSAPDPGNRPVLSRDEAAARAASAQLGATPVPATPAASGAVQRPSGFPAAASTPGAADVALVPHQEPRPVDGGLSWSMALRTLLSVAVVVVLIVLCGRLLKRFMASAAQPGNAGANVRVVETTYLPAPSGRGRAAIHLLEVGERLLLVGATDAQLTLLAEFDEGDSVQRAKLLLPPDMAAAAAPAAPAAAGLEPAPQPAGAPAPPPARPQPAFSEMLVEATNLSNAEPHATNGTTGTGNSTGNGTRNGSGHGTHHSDDYSFGEENLAVMLARLRDSRRRLEGEN